MSTSALKRDGETYNTTYEFYDSLLRPLQTQSPTPLGGRVLTDTRYDTRGLAYETYEDIFDSASTPNGTYTREEYGEAPRQTETVYDGAERPTTSTLYVYGVKKWSTTTSYTGDSTATTAVQGGSATRTITDARGRTVETRQYAGTSPADPEFGGGSGTTSYTSTKFQYKLDDKQSQVTGPDGASWTYGYDLFGRKTSADDPDKGLTELGLRRPRPAHQDHRLPRQEHPHRLRRTRPHDRHLDGLEDRRQPADRPHLRHPPQGSAGRDHPLRRRQDRQGVHQDRHRLRQPRPGPPPPN